MTIPVAIFNDTRNAYHYGCSCVMRNLNQKLYQHGLTPKYYFPNGLNWLDYQDNMKYSFKELNIKALIINGEGSLHFNKSDDLTNNIIFLGKLAQELNIPAYMINTTITNDIEPYINELKTFKRIYTRETESKNILDKFDVEALLSYDLSLAYPYDMKIKNRNGKIIITDSANAYARDLLINMARAHDTNYQTMSTCYSFFNNNLIIRPYKYLHKLYHKWPYLKQVNQNFKKQKKGINPQVIKNKFANAKHVYTGRFHATTLCFLTDTPVVACESNTHKIGSILQDCFNNQNRLKSLNDIYNMLKSNANIEYSKKEFEQLQNYKETAISTIDKMFQDIYIDINSPNT